VRGTWREGSLTGDPRGDAPFPGNLREGEIFQSGELLLGNPRDTKMKALEMGSSLHRCPFGKHLGGFHLLGTVERQMK